MLKGSAREYYHMYLLSEELSFDEMIIRIKTHFETAERQRLMMSEWRNITLRRTIEQNPSKSIAECFEMIVLQLRKVQLGLPDRFRGDLSLRDAMIDAVRDIRECSLACYKPAATFEPLCADIRASITTEEYLKNNASLPASNSSFPLSPDHIDHQLDIDRRYGGGKMKQRVLHQFPEFQKVFYEKNKAFKTFKERLRMHNKPYDDHKIHQYVIECEGINDTFDDDEYDLYDSLILNLDLGNDGNDKKFSDAQYFTRYGEISGYDTVAKLNDQSVQHAIALIDSSYDSRSIHGETMVIPFKDFLPIKSPSLLSSENSPFSFTQSTRYLDSTFHGIIIDTGAAKVSTAGYNQFLALCKIQNLHLNKSQAGQARICFGIGTAISLGSTIIETKIGKITFHVVPSDTPFLLCLQDMDALHVKFDNLKTF
ncbi:hypothetical protein K3495_g9620 [Podosphaera aphanis]|nr:hypothetical protein K3495_g9620 [Podosphaera aphanis]